MTRLILGVILIAALAGVGLGWWASLPAGDHCPPTEATDNQNTGPPTAELRHQFRLPAADLKGSELPAVAVDNRGRVLLAWASETAANEKTLFLTRSEDGGSTFAAPTPFRKVGVRRYQAKSRGQEVTRVTKVMPRLAVHGATFYLAWSEPSGSDRVELFVAQSSDGGRTFTEPTRAHSSGAKRPGYTGLAVGLEGTPVCVWLDSRNGRQQPFCAVGKAGTTVFAAERLVYPGPEEQGVCPCCDVDVLRTAAGDTLVAFRNNADNIRDTFVSRCRAGASAFEEPVPTSDHGWKFPGCPHDGPVMALSRDRLHVVWMDGHSGRQRVYYARSGLHELKFSSRPLDEKSPGQQGHPRLAVGGGYLHAVWDGSLTDEPAPSKGASKHQHGQPTGNGRAIQYARWLDTTDGPEVVRALDPRPGVFQLNPAVAVGSGGEVFVVWSEIAESGKSVVLLRLSALTK